MERLDAVVVGAGIVGLAIASEIAKQDRQVFILERENMHGQGQSSRNSEVIHSGTSYPNKSLRTNLCVKANKMIYEICRQNNIPHKRIGKLIVATNEQETKELEELIEKGRDNGIRDLEMLDGDQVSKLEPHVKAEKAILSPSTGIIDAHAMMDYFLRKARQNLGYDPLSKQTEVVGLTQHGDGWKVDVISVGEKSSVEARVVINSAGLHSDKIAHMAGMDNQRERYKIHWCKGDYFKLQGRPITKMLVYPTPRKDAPGVGIHAITDLGGGVKFGPNSYYVDKIDYKVESNPKEFWQCLTPFLPSIKLDDLVPDMAGIRAKLQGPGEGFRDYVIRHEEDKGFTGLINLIGIESPGVTSSPAIAEMVADIVNRIL